MKKYLLLLIPLGLWIVCYFVWTIPIPEKDFGGGLWIVLTDILLTMTVGFSLFKILDKLTD